MRRPAIVAFLAVLAVSAVALVAVGLTQGSTLVYTPGVGPYAPVLELSGGQRACVAPIHVPSGSTLERVRVFAGTAGLPGPPLEVALSPESAGPDLATGRVAGGYRAGEKPIAITADVGRVRPRDPVVACVRNAGTAKVSLFGAGTIASAPVTTLDGVPAGGDISVRFERAQERSLLASLADVAERASRFKPGWAAPFVLALLAALVLLGVPALLALALRRAAP